ncbi:hypothetical protein BJX64DRAFT_167967 [Aspergillus heterothallicus]
MWSKFKACVLCRSSRYHSNPISSLIHTCPAASPHSISPFETVHRDTYRVHTLIDIHISPTSNAIIKSCSNQPQLGTTIPTSNRPVVLQCTKRNGNSRLEPKLYTPSPAHVSKAHNTHGHGHSKAAKAARKSPCVSQEE